jgi:hypothetical protein
MARAQALEFPVLLAHCERQVRMATADGLTAGGLKVIEVASTDVDLLQFSGERFSSYPASLSNCTGLT